MKIDIESLSYTLELIDYLIKNGEINDKYEIKNEEVYENIFMCLYFDRRIEKIKSGLNQISLALNSLSELFIKMKNNDIIKNFELFLEEDKDNLIKDFEIFSEEEIKH